MTRMDNSTVTLYEQTDSDDVAFPSSLKENMTLGCIYLTLFLFYQPWKMKCMQFLKISNHKVGEWAKWYHIGNDSWNDRVCSPCKNIHVGQELLFCCCKVLEVKLQRDPAARSQSSPWMGALGSATLVSIHLGLHSERGYHHSAFPGTHIHVLTIVVPLNHVN